MCKNLFIFAFGEHLPYFNQLKTLKALYSQFQDNDNIQVIQNEHYFNAARYLPSERESFHKGVEFIEKAFLLIVYNELGAKKRFLKKYPTSLTSKMEKNILHTVYKNSEVAIIEIED